MVIAKGGEGGSRTLHFLARAIIPKNRGLEEVHGFLYLKIIAKGGEGGSRPLHFLARAIIPKNRGLEEVHGFFMPNGYR
ncbi:hypothetical protein NBRC116585_16070 [Thalassolituus maritimus]|uniref:Uncharacterized protein n=2 Tax=Thalassolituus maritimus TaxID=484498 RepID=A0ABP9ZZF3_9GAMM